MGATVQHTSWVCMWERRLKRLAQLSTYRNYIPYHRACFTRGALSFYLDMYIFFWHMVSAQGTVQAAGWVITLGMHIIKLLACGNSGISASVWFYWSSILPVLHMHFWNICVVCCALVRLSFWVLLTFFGICFQCLVLSVTLLWPFGIFEEAMLSIALIFSLYFVRTYNHFIRQWLEELICLGVIYILHLVLSAVYWGFAVTMLLSPYVTLILLIYFWCGWDSTSIPFKCCFSSAVENSWFDGLCAQ